MFSIETFCTIPWSSIVILPSGDFRICCFGGTQDHGIGVDNNNEVMNVLTHSIEDAMNSSLHKSVRLAQSKNIKHSACDVCWKKEASHLESKKENSYRVDTAGAYSYRIGRTFKHDRNAVSMQDADIMMQPDGSIKNVPISLDLRFTNLCNAKCIQCDPRYSSLWYHDHMLLTGKDEFYFGPKKYTIKQDGNKLVTDIKAWHDNPIWWDQFERIKQNVRQLYITGGEPFIQKAHSELLDRIDDELASKIRIRYDTNLTVINQNILDKLSKFKEVTFGVSVDDHGKRYELIRYPCSWKRLNENLQKLLTYENFNFTITNCVGIFSIFTPMRVIPHFSQMGINKFSFRLVSHPSCYDLAFLSNKAKRYIIEEYDRSDVAIQHKAVIVGYLKKTMDKYLEEQLNGFVNRMNKLDEIRGTDWKSVMPDVLDLVTLRD